MKIDPRGDHIVAVPLEAPTKIGQVILPESGREMMMARPLGVVQAVGSKVNEPGSEDEPIEPGDVITYWRGQAQRLQGADEKMYIQLRASDVIGHVNSDEQASADEQARIEARYKKIKAEQEEQLSKAVRAANLTDSAGLPIGRLAE